MSTYVLSLWLSVVYTQMEERSSRGQRLKGCNCVYDSSLYLSLAPLQHPSVCATVPVRVCDRLGVCVCVGKCARACVCDCSLLVTSLMAADLAEVVTPLAGFNLEQYHRRSESNPWAVTSDAQTQSETHQTFVRLGRWKHPDDLQQTQRGRIMWLTVKGNFSRLIASNDAFWTFCYL